VGCGIRFSLSLLMIPKVNRSDLSLVACDTESKPTQLPDVVLCFHVLINAIQISLCWLLIPTANQS